VWCWRESAEADEPANDTRGNLTERSGEKAVSEKAEGPREESFSKMDFSALFFFIYFCRGNFRIEIRYVAPFRGRFIWGFRFSLLFGRQALLVCIHLTL
jgi:hypothetical protein